LKRRLFNAARRLQQQRRPAALVTDLGSGMQSLVHSGTVEGDFGLEDELLALILGRIGADSSGIIDHYDVEYFVQVLNPPLRLIIIGAVHIAQALAPMAGLLGYDVTIVDPRRAFASDARFPTVRLHEGWPDEALTELRPDSRTAIVALSHDPKLDDPALTAALASPAFYIGALGSRKSQAKRLERLAEAGLDATTLTRIRGPVGLPIGAVTPAEIAVSILAEMTQARRSPPGES
jgi:xanthine dehydrogenase accessory factor